MKPLWEKEESIGFRWEDLQGPEDSAVWKDEIALRIREEMIKVAQNPKGTLMIGVDLGYFDNLPDLTDFQHIEDVSAEEIRGYVVADETAEHAKRLAGQIRTLYTERERRDFLSLHFFPTTF